MHSPTAPCVCVSTPGRYTASGLTSQTSSLKSQGFPGHFYESKKRVCHKNLKVQKMFWNNERNGNSPCWIIYYLCACKIVGAARGTRRLHHRHLHRRQRQHVPMCTQLCEYMWDSVAKSLYRCWYVCVCLCESTWVRTLFLYESEVCIFTSCFTVILFV